MSQITDIKVAKGKKSRRHIYIDDNFACTLDEFTVFKYRLKVGQGITISELEQIACESEAGTAFELAVNLISKTPKTRWQIWEYLKNKGYLPKVCNISIQKLIEYRYIDDEQYAKMYVNTYAHKYGKTKMKCMLASKGVSQNIITDVLEEMPSQDEAILGFARKYMKNLEHNKQNYAKLCRFLAGKGFGWSEINSAVEKLKGENDENWD